MARTVRGQSQRGHPAASWPHTCRPVSSSQAGVATVSHCTLPQPRDSGSPSRSCLTNKDLGSERGGPHPSQRSSGGMSRLLPGLLSLPRAAVFSAHPPRASQPGQGPRRAVNGEHQGHPWPLTVGLGGSWGCSRCGGWWGCQACVVSGDTRSPVQAPLAAGLSQSSPPEWP